MGNGTVRLFVSVVVVIGAILFSPISIEPAVYWNKADLSSYTATKYNAQIYRDRWGVPHIVGKTEADVGFGLAWVQCEDDFALMQKAALSTKGRMAEVFGTEAAPIDWMFKLIRTQEYTDNTYPLLSREAVAMIEGFTAGWNHYAATHLDELVLHDFFPLHPKDIAAAFVFRAPFFCGLDAFVMELMEGKPPTVIQTETRGSSAFAVGKDKTTDGSTHLLVNSHQPWTGPLSWYEAHLMTSDGSLNMTGGFFWGSPFMLHGHNPHLGWAITVNVPDLVDVFKLEMVGNSRNTFWVDKRKHHLIEQEDVVKVKLFGPVFWNSKQVFRWSVVHDCPVIESEHGFYCIKFVFGDARSADFFYKLGKTQSLSEWNHLLSQQQLPSMNWVYGDKHGNIQYLYNAKLPKRSTQWDYKTPVWGNTTENLWNGFEPFEDTAIVIKNPESGFVVSCNSDPFGSTIGKSQPDKSKYKFTQYLRREFMTGRALRAVDLLHNDGKRIEPEYFEVVKNDEKVHPDSDLGLLLSLAIKWGEENSNNLKNQTDRDSLRILQQWDRVFSRENKLAALPMLSLAPEIRIGGTFKGDARFEKATKNPEEVLWPLIRRAASTLLRVHGTLEVPLHRVIRGINPYTASNVGLSGGPDVLRCIYPTVDHTTGQGTAFQGDSLYMFVEWDKDGNVRSRSSHQFGVSGRIYDNLPDFAEKTMRPVHMSEDVLRHNAYETYHVPRK